MIRWESEEDWKAWETSEAHLAGHKAERGKPSPSYIIEGKQDVYHVLTTKVVLSEVVFLDVQKRDITRFNFVARCFSCKQHVN